MQMPDCCQTRNHRHSVVLKLHSVITHATYLPQGFDPDFLRQVGLGELLEGQCARVSIKQDASTFSRSKSFNSQQRPTCRMHVHHADQFAQRSSAGPSCWTRVIRAGGRRAGLTGRDSRGGWLH